MYIYRAVGTGDPQTISATSPTGARGAWMLGLGVCAWGCALAHACVVCKVTGIRIGIGITTGTGTMHAVTTVHSVYAFAQQCREGHAHGP